MGNSVLRQEAMQGPSAFMYTPAELRQLSPAYCKKVDPEHVSICDLYKTDYRWGRFETKADLCARTSLTVRSLADRHRGNTLVFVSHGSPTQTIYKELVGRDVPAGSGGMTALSILRLASSSPVSGLWEPLISNSADHA